MYSINVSWNRCIYRQKQPLEVFCEKRCSLKFRKNLQENTCARVTFLIKVQASGLEETLAHVFFCEFCEILKNTFVTEHLWTTAFV